MSSEEGWEEKLKEMCAKLNCRLAYDAVSGSLTGSILHAMPVGSTVKVYGDLSGQPSSGIFPSDLIFGQKKVEGFWLTGYMKTKNIIGIYSWTRTISKLMKKSLSTSVRKVYGIDDASVALADYMGNMSLGKVAFTPNDETKKDPADSAEQKEDKAEAKDGEKEEPEQQEAEAAEASEEATA